MQIYNNKTYYNSIYSAIVVNTDTGLDPTNSGRFQIYIPSIQYEYDGVYEQYISDSNKKESKYFGCFPWATTLITDISDGDLVYGSFVNNTNGNYIILGKDGSSKANAGYGGDSIQGLDIVKLTMPAILMEETGYGKADCPNLPEWPDEVEDYIFETIENTSTAARGIGILQWTASRAFDLLYDIAKASNGSWESCWSDKSLQLYKDIKSAINTGTTKNHRNNNAMCNPMASGCSTYNSVKNMLKLPQSRTVQESKAPEETQNAINILQSDPYNISNPGIIIFYADIMNQYGNGVNSVIPNCITNAAKVDKNGSTDLMSQVTEVYNQWINRTSLYKERRYRVYTYIGFLNEQGKLNSSPLVDFGDLASSKYIPEAGDYLWPTPKSDQVNCYYGYYNDGDKDEHNRPYDIKYNYAGIHYGSFHYGVDFGPQKAGVDGDPVIAGGNGTVAYVCSPAEGQSAGQGGCIGIRMDRNSRHYLVYMHLCKKPEFKVGDRVRAGQVIGYMGNTGNSSGTHLHVGLHIGSVWPLRNESVRKDVLPYLGKTLKS